MPQIDIKDKLKPNRLYFKSYPKDTKVAKVNIAIKDIQTQNVTDYSHDFIIDTGASISVVNSKFSDFFDTLVQKDTLPIRYGTGPEKKLPVYDVIFIIKGKEISTTVLYDKESPYLLLGFYNFIDKLDYLLIDATTYRFRL